MVDETRKEVQDLLADEKNFTTRAGLRLVLSMLMEIDGTVKQQAEENKKTAARVQVLEEKSIIIWAEKHKKTAVAYALILFAVLNAWFVSGFRKPFIYWMFKHLLGVEIPIEAIP